MKPIESRHWQLVRRWHLKVFVCTFLFVHQLEGAAPAENLIFEDTQVHAKYPQVSGSPIWPLEAVVVRIGDNRRHPLAVFIDGTPETSPRPMLYVARELARRGWTTVAVMRPGYGKSQGKEPPGQCGNYVTQANFAAQTLRETIRAMETMSYVDPSRSIAVGHSTGGLGAVAVTVNPPANLVASISFAGNNGSQYLNGKLDTVCAPADVIRAFATFGSASKIPMLWIYAQNDHHMGPALAQAYYQAFSSAGGKVDFEMAPETEAGTDGHMLYSMPAEVSVWSAFVDKFFADQHLALISPPVTIDVPNMPPPAALSASGRNGFAGYLAAMPHKAFAMSTMHWGSSWLSDSTDDAVKKAMANCKSTDDDPCRTIMVDDQPTR
jgi:dienelactone hydrolase